MKFAKELEKDLVPEWRAKYLDYKLGKKKVKAVGRSLSRVNRTPRSPRRTPSFLPSRGHATPQTLLRNSLSHGDVPRLQNSTPTIPRSAGGNGDSLQRGRSGSAKYYGDREAERRPLTGQKSTQQRSSENTPRLTRYGSIVGTPPQQPADKKKAASTTPGIPEEDDEVVRAPTLELPAAAIPAHGRDDADTSFETGNGGFRRVEWSLHPDSAYDREAPKAPKPSPGGYKSLISRFHSKSADNVHPVSRRIQSLRRRHSEMGSPGDSGIPLDDYKEYEFRQYEFFRFLDLELNKIETFYKEKEDEATKRLGVLRDQLHIMRDRRLDELMAAEEAKKRSKKRYHDSEDLLDPSTSKSEDSTSNGPNHAHSNGGYLPKPLSHALQLAREGIGGSSKPPKFISSPDHDQAQKVDNHRDYSRRPEFPDIPYKTAKRKLKTALQEFYRGLELLKSYALLNRTAFRKINKKYDKAVQARPPLRYMSEKVNQAWFVQSDVLDGHILAVEDLYARYFEKGNHKLAVGKLRAKTARAGVYAASSFRNGLMIAAGLVFGIEGLVSSSELLFDPDPTLSSDTSYLLQIYAGYFLMLLLILIFCFDCRIWKASKINFAFVFEFDTRHHLDWRQLCELPCFTFFLLGFFMWLNFNRYGSDAMYIYYPVILIGVTLILLFLPVPFLYHRMRQWFLYSNWRLLLSGLYPVEFRDFFLGDMYCSQTYSMGNLEVFFCLYANDWKNPSQCNSSHSRFLGFLSTLPGIWRAIQCIRRYWDTRNIFPHLVNCGKYAFTILYYMSLSLYRFNHTPGLQACFIFFATVNAIYCSIWDVVMDWSLGNPYAPHPFLRDVLGYQPWFYYMAMVIDPILRFNWIFYAIYSEDTQHSAILSFFVSLSEVLRRGMWTLIRVENEHCTNVGRFRASRDVPLPYEVPSTTSSALPSPETVGHAPPMVSQTDPVRPSHESPAVASGRSARTPRTRDGTTPTATGTDLDLERQASRTSTGGQVRRRRPTIVPSPLITRVGTMLHTAHAQDFERRKKPEVGKTPNPEREVDHSSDEDEEEDEPTDEEQTQVQDLLEGQTGSASLNYGPPAVTET